VRTSFSSACWLAKSSFDAMNSGLTQGGAKAIMSDRILAHHGPEAKDARNALRRIIANCRFAMAGREHRGHGFEGR
jgi:hypothetical protein